MNLVERWMQRAIDAQVQIVLWKKCRRAKKYYLGGGFKYCLFSPLLGEDSQFG